LGLRILLIEDETAIARTLALRCRSMLESSALGTGPPISE
jgi:hypothetical protein